MRSRVIPASLLIGVVAFEAVGLVTLHRLGSVPGLTIDWSNLGTWLELTAAEDAVVAVVRLIALGVAYWLAATTALYLMAKLAGIPSLVRGVRWATLPAVRHLVDGLMATSIVAVSTVSPALAIAQEAPRAPVAETHTYTPVPADDGDPSYTPTPAGDTQPTPTTAPQPASTDTPAAPAAAPATHVVVAGDNLWTIAERHVAGVAGRPADELRLPDVHAYWVRLIDANLGRLVSGDPDLIYPGEELTLPPVTVD